MFSYGEDNVVDFTKLNGIIGLFNLLMQVVSQKLLDDTGILFV